MNRDYIDEDKWIINPGHTVEICPLCYTDLYSVLEEGRVGCPECYNAFRQVIRHIKMQCRVTNEPVRN